MTDPRPKSNGQVRAIYGLAKQCGLDNEALHELVADVLYSSGSGSRRGNSDALGEASTLVGNRSGCGAEAVSQATTARAVEQRSGVRDQKSARGSSPTMKEGAVSIAALTHAEAERVIQRLKGKSFVPLRTLQHRRQRAGVSQIVAKEQLLKIADLASQRKWSSESLVNFCKRQCGHYPLRTTADANKVIEALKAMNKREGLWAA